MYVCMYMKTQILLSNYSNYSATIYEKSID
jgi:hypothetical protein